MPLQSLAKFLIGMGLWLVVLGILLWSVPNIPYLGKLPGDILIKKDHVTFYFPLMTSLVLSILVSLILWLFRK